MAAETAFIDALAAYLQAQPALAGTQVGAAEPVAAANLPAVVLWLPEVHRLGAGLGEGAALVTGGALPVLARVDLANPVLPQEPTFRLLSEDRRTLVLPHGGWVKADATTGPMVAADLQVSVGGASRTVVNAAPAADQVQPDPAVGTLLFGAALPALGIVQANYFLGQWERRMTPIAGALRVDVRAADAAEVQALSQAVLDALDPASGAVLPRGLRKAVLGAVSAVGAPAPLLAGSRGRELSFAFEYEHEVNQPDSSGGVIGRITVLTRLITTVVEPGSGAITTTLTTETSEVPT
jgi:hypothetical protein